jgi:hypothetical protein
VKLTALATEHSHFHRSSALLFGTARSLSRAMLPSLFGTARQRRCVALVFRVWAARSLSRAMLPSLFGTARSRSAMTYVVVDVARSRGGVAFMCLLCAAWLSTACRPSASVGAPKAASAAAHDYANPEDHYPASAAQSETAEAEDDYSSDPDAIGDEDDTAESDASDDTEPRVAHPFDSLSNAQLADQLKADPKLLGSASLGRPNSGRLFNAVQLPEDPIWKRVDPSHAWGTPETVEYLTKALRAVVERYPDTAAVSVGHLSAPHGGPLRPHVSHQSGRDVDVGFYYANEPNHWYKRANQANLDLPRTWWLIRTLVLETDIEMILLDRSLSKLVEDYALESGEPREWVEGIFHSKNGRPPIVRHASGHATHLHLRFFNPVAQKSGRRLMPLLVERKIVAPPQQMLTHVARTGDTLAKLAARYNTTMQAIRQANAMKTYQLVAGAAYRIPVRGRGADAAPSKVPARRTPSRANKAN